MKSPPEDTPAATNGPGKPPQTPVYCAPTHPPSSAQPPRCIRYRYGGGGGASTDVVAELRSLLGNDVVLLPLARGRKGPTDEGWQKTTLAAMEDPAYLDRLARGNIGVLQGDPSKGLCSIDCDDDAAVQEFLQLNPGLADTLRTKGRRGCNFWVRIQGEYPRLTTLTTAQGKDWGEWRSTGGQTVIHGTHPAGGQYRILHRAKPIEIRFEDISWPSDLVLPWAKVINPESPLPPPQDDVEVRYGQPFAPTKDGAVGALNERFWAGLYASEHDIVHDPVAKEFYEYDPGTGLWQLASADWIRERIAQRITQVADEQDRQDLKLKATVLKLGHAVTALRGIAEARGFFDNRPRVIHVATGVLELRDDGEVTFTDPQPEHRSRNRSPIAWDAEAEAPRFEAFLESALDPDDIDLFQRYFGVCLYGQNLPQRILLLDGGPNTGKSTAACIVQAVVGIENTYQLRTECLAERFEVFRYRGKTLLLGPDVPGDFLGRRGASMLKSLVGGDPLSAEGKGLNGDFPIRGTFNVLITSNSRLRVRLEGDTGAWRRRLTILRFAKPPPEKRILNLADVLVRDEGPGILRWALSGFVRAVREFKETGDFILTDPQRDRVDALLTESDSLRVFLAETVECTSETKDLSVDEIVTKYAQFCATRGWNVLPDKFLHRQLPDLMLELFHTPKAHSVIREERSVRGYRGVQFKETTDAA